MKKITLNEIEYELEKDYKNALDLDELKEKFTEYFEEFDYVLGDYSYDKLRLKGFYAKENKNLKEWNDYSKIEDYLKDYCSYDCRYFILKKSTKSNKNA